MASKKNGIVFEEELNRAAQFLPFDALKGLSEELRKREERRTHVDRLELAEEQAAIVNEQLCRLQVGSQVEICFYYKGHYLTVEGTINKIVPQMKYLTMGTERINFGDIYKVQIVR